MSCLANCSYHGTCVSSACLCNSGYVWDDCSAKFWDLVGTYHTIYAFLFSSLNLLISIWVILGLFYSYRFVKQTNGKYWNLRNFLLLCSLIGLLGRILYMVSENTMYRLDTIYYALLSLSWSLSTIVWILGYVAMVLVWIQMKNQITEDTVHLDLRKLRNVVIILDIIAMIGLVPSLFLRLISSIASIMDLIFNLFLVVYLAVMVVLYWIFGGKLWWITRNLEKSVFATYRKNGGGGVHQLMRMTEIIHLGNIGVLFLVIPTLVWTILDPNSYNPYLFILFQSLLRAADVLAVGSFTYAVHPMRKTTVRKFFNVLFGKELPSDSVKSEVNSESVEDIETAQVPLEKYTFSEENQN